MNKLKTFVRTLLKSFTDPNYYNDILKAPFKFSLKYFLVFYLIFITGLTGIGSYFLFQKAPAAIDTALSSAADLYPEDLILHFNASAGEVTTEGVEEPVIIPIPDNQTLDVNLDNLAVIDTTATLEDFDTYNTVFLLTKTHLLVRNQARINGDQANFGPAQVFPLREINQAFKDDELGIEITDLKIDKSLITSNLPFLSKLLHQLVKFLPLIAFFFLVLFYLPTRLLIVYILGLITAILTALAGHKLSYQKNVQLSLHTFIVADVISKLAWALYPHQIPYMRLLAFTGITLIATLALKTKKK